MRNQEIAKGLRLIAEGFTTLAVAYEKEPVVTGVDMSSSEGDKTNLSIVEPITKEVIKQEVVKEEPKEVKEEVITESEPVSEGNFPTEDGLNALSYNDLKAKAKELGLKAVGSKKVLIENILASIGNADVISDEPTKEDIEEAIEEVAELPTEDRGEEIEIDEDEEALPEEETLYDQVAKDLEGYADEELANILSDIGVSPKGRRQALLAKIVQAIEDGKLEWEEDSEPDDNEPQEATEPSKDVETQDDQTIEEEDFVGTEARKQACLELCDQIESDYENGDISHKEVLKFLKEYYNGKYVSQGQEADLDEYLAIQCDLIDDEGTKHEMSDPYYVGDDVLCCGAVLKELNEDLYCEHCGVTYENQ